MATGAHLLTGLALSSSSASSFQPSTSSSNNNLSMLNMPLTSSFFNGGVGALKVIESKNAPSNSSNGSKQRGGALGARMNLFYRFARVVKSYANSVLSTFEDPEKILDQTVLQMNDDLTKMRQATAQVLASQKRLENKYKAAQQASEEWYRKAQFALQKGDEDLAREALKRRKSNADGANSLKAQLDQQKTVVENLISNTRLLESKIQEAKSKKDTLKARAQSAKTATKVSELLGNVNTSSALSAFEKMEEKVILPQNRINQVKICLDSVGSGVPSRGSRTSLGHGISEEDMKLVMEMKADAMKTVIGQGGETTSDDGVLLTMSTLTEEGVIAVKNAACERLLNQRVELKLKSKKINDCLNRFHVAMPKPRDKIERPPCIPKAVLQAGANKQAAEMEKKKTERDLEDENGGAGVYSASLKKNYILADDAWKEDIIPEILDGHNVYDFVDPDILLRLEELEREEGLRESEEVDDDFEMDGKDLTPEEQKALAEIRKKKSLLIQQHRIKKSIAESRPIVPRKFNQKGEFTTDRMSRQLSALGLDPSLAITRARSKSVTGIGRKRDRSVDNHSEAMDMDEDTPNKKLRWKSRSLSMSRSRSRSRPPHEFSPAEGFKDSAQKMKAIKLGKKAVKNRNKEARRGEADRVIPTLKPKHLYSGKRSIGKTQRR